MADSAPATPTATPTPAPAPDADAARKARKAAKKELRGMHGKESAKDFDAKRYHELHYLAAGKPVPSIDPDDLD